MNSLRANAHGSAGESLRPPRLILPAHLETPRLRIRPFVPDDFEAFAAFMADEEATRYLLFTTEQKTRQGARAILESALGSYRTDEPIFVLAVVDKEEGGYVGSCGLSLMPEGLGYECFYTVVRARWGRGYGTEILKGLLAYAFHECRLERVVALIMPENVASGRVAEKAGMTYDGLVVRTDIDQEMMHYSARRYTWIPS